MKGLFNEISGNKNCTLVPTNEGKGKIKKCGDLGSKIGDLIRSITKNSDDSDEKYMKIKFDSNDNLPLNKAIETSSIIIVVRAVFYEYNKYYPKVFLDEYLYKLRIIKKCFITI